MSISARLRHLKPEILILSLLVVIILWIIAIYTPILRYEINDYGIRLDHFAEIFMTIYLLVFLSLSLTEIHYRKDKKDHIKVWNRWKFVIFYFAIAISYTWSMGVHWSMNLVNVLAEEAEISLMHLGPMVYFFDERLGHFLPYTFILILYCYLLWFDSKKPLSKNKVNIVKIISVSVPFGLLLGVSMIESSFGNLILVILILSQLLFLLSFITRKISISWIRSRPYIMATIIIIFVSAVTMFVWQQMFDLDIQPSFLFCP